jgi:hypothetical protein
VREFILLLIRMLLLAILVVCVVMLGYDAYCLAFEHDYFSRGFFLGRSDYSEYVEEKVSEIALFALIFAICFVFIYAIDHVHIQHEYLP